MPFYFLSFAPALSNILSPPLKAKRSTPAIRIFQRVKHKRGGKGGGVHFISAHSTDIKQHVRLVHLIDRFRPVPIFVPIFCLFQSNLNPLQFGNDTYPPVRMSEILPQFGLLLFS